MRRRREKDASCEPGSSESYLLGSDARHGTTEYEETKRARKLVWAWLKAIIMNIEPPTF